MRTVAVIQARSGSTRLAGKILAPIEGLPLMCWTITAVAAVQALDEIVVATTDDPEDDRFAEMVARRTDVTVHRGSVHDVLTRVWDAVAPRMPDVVLRQTGDNPFADPAIMDAQLRRLLEGTFDYVGIDGLPLGVGAEAVRIDALRAAYEEATDAADREHVLPYVYSRPRRFRIGALESPPRAIHHRYTIDTDDDLAFARELARRWGKGPPVSLADLEAIVAADRGLTLINAAVAQRDRTHAQLKPAVGGEEE